MPRHLAMPALPYALSPATSSMPRHRMVSTSDADVIRATCHPSSGDTCHLRIGPTVRPKVQICLPRVTTRELPCVTCTDLPCVVYMDLPCQRTDMPRQRPYGLYGLHSQQFFLPV
jgi:hypothetical protein